MGYSDITIKWFESYLDERMQQVILSDIKSTTTASKMGIPQGSVMGPFIFIIYINIILKLLHTIDKNLRGIGFVDDTTLLFRFKSTNTKQSIAHLNLLLTKIVKWFDGLKLKLNPSKSVMVLFKTTQRKYTLTETVMLRGQHMTLADTAKSLGLTFSANMSWQPHTNSLLPKLYATTATLRRLRDLGMSKDTLYMVYCALMEPILSYAIVLWGGAPINTLNSINIAQNDAIRTLLGKPRFTSVTSLYNENKILRLNTLYVRDILVFAHKERTNTDVSEWQRNVGPNTRNIHKHIINKDNLEVRRRGLSNQKYLKWESLPEKYKICQRTKQFRKNIMPYLLELQNPH
jgi:hypothetical protein